MTTYDFIRQCLESQGVSMRSVSSHLKISRSTFYRRLHSHKLDRWQLLSLYYRYLSLCSDVPDFAVFVKRFYDNEF